MTKTISLKKVLNDFWEKKFSFHEDTIQIIEKSSHHEEMVKEVESEMEQASSCYASFLEIEKKLLEAYQKLSEQ